MIYTSNRLLATWFICAECDVGRYPSTTAASRLCGYKPNSGTRKIIAGIYDLSNHIFLYRCCLCSVLCVNLFAWGEWYFSVRQDTNAVECILTSKRLGNWERYWQVLNSIRSITIRKLWRCWIPLLSIELSGCFFYSLLWTSWSWPKSTRVRSRRNSVWIGTCSYLQILSLLY